MYKQKEYYPCAGEFFHRLPKIIQELNFAVHRTGFIRMMHRHISLELLWIMCEEKEGQRNGLAKYLIPSNPLNLFLRIIVLKIKTRTWPDDATHKVGLIR